MLLMAGEENSNKNIYEEYVEKCDSVYVVSEKEDSEAISSDGEFNDA